MGKAPQATPPTEPPPEPPPALSAFFGGAILFRCAVEDGVIVIQQRDPDGKTLWEARIPASEVTEDASR